MESKKRREEDLLREKDKEKKWKEVNNGFLP